MQPNSPPKIAFRRSDGIILLQNVEHIWPLLKLYTPWRIGDRCWVSCPGWGVDTQSRVFDMFT